MREWWLDHGAQVLEVYAPWGISRHLKVWRHDGKSGIDWDILQAIKTEMVGDAWMVEVYPPEEAVVNEVNMRHLWEVPEHHIVNMKR